MSTREATRRQTRARPNAVPPLTGGQRRRRLLAVAAAIALVVATVMWLVPRVNHAVENLGLPLADTAIIRQQAADKHLDPALIAAVIYAETKFQPRTSPAGAEGLMQIEPATASYLAHMSGGYKFTMSDLGTPAINVAYGSYYLRYLLDHFDNNEMLAVAAYNGGLTNVQHWVDEAHAQGRELTADMIPFAETRAYVHRVLAAQREYRARYARQLGLSP